MSAETSATLDTAKATLAAKAKGADAGVHSVLSDIQQGTGVRNAGRGLSLDQLPVLTLESQCALWCIGQVPDLGQSRVLVGTDALIPAGPATKAMNLSTVLARPTLWHCGRCTYWCWACGRARRLPRCGVMSCRTCATQRLSLEAKPPMVNLEQLLPRSTRHKCAVSW